MKSVIKPSQAFDPSLLIGIALLVSALVISGGVNYASIMQMREDLKQVGHTHQVQEQLSKVFSLVQDAETGQRGFIIAGEERYLEPYLSALDQIEYELDKLSKLTKDNALQQSRLPPLRQRITARLVILRENIELRRAQGLDAVRSNILRGRGKVQMDMIRKQIQDMSQEEQVLLSTRNIRSERSSRTAAITGIVTAIAGLFSMVAFIWQVNRSLQAKAKAAADIHQERQQLKVTLTSIGDGVIATDPQGRVTFLNQVAEELCGWTSEDAAGQPLETVFDIVNEDTRLKVDNPAFRALEEGVIVGLANHTILISKNKSEKAIADSAAPIRGLDGEMLGAVLVFRDVSDERRDEKIILQSEARKRAILETSLDAIVTCDHEGRIIEFNTAAEKMFGYSRQQAQGQKLVETIIPPSLRDRHRQGMERYIATGKEVVLNQRVELVAQKSSGEEFPIELAVTSISTDGPALFTGYIRDISDRKRTEAALAERHRLLALTADVSKSLSSKDNLPEMLQGCVEAIVEYMDAASAQVWGLSDDGNFLELQATAGENSHLTVTQKFVPVGQYAAGVVAKERVPHYTSTIAGDPKVPEQEWAEQEGLVAFAGYPLLVEDRVVGVVAMFAKHPFKEHAQTALATVAGEIAVSMDRQYAIRAVRESSKLMQVTLASIGDAVLTTDASGRVTFLNEVAQTLTGWNQIDAAGQPTEVVFNIVNETTNEPLENPVRRVLEEGVIVGLANHTVLISKDGTRRPIDDSGAPIRVEDKIVGTVLVFRDVTDRRRSESLLTDQNQVLESIVQGDDLEEVLSDLCRAVEVQLGKGAIATVLLKDDGDGHLHPAAAPSAPKGYTEELNLIDIGPESGSCGTAAYRGETVVVNNIAADPLWDRWREIALKHDLHACWSTPIIASTGSVLGAFAIYHSAPYEPGTRDLQLVSVVARTAGIAVERRQSDVRLRASEERVRMALTATRMVSRETFPSSGSVTVSPNAGEVFGLLESEKLTTLAQMEALIHPKDLARYQQSVASAVESQIGYMLQFRILRPDDKALVWIEERGQPIFNEAGKLSRIVSVAMDVTDRRHADERLRESQANAAIALSVAQLGTWTWNLDRGEVTADERCRQICGLPEEAIMPPDAISKRIHPEDWGRVEPALQAALTPGSDGHYAGEFRFVHPDGTVRWVISHGQAIYHGESGARRPSLMLGTVIDITQRKQLEESLRNIAVDLSEANRRKNEFLATLAHELRNPLAPIRTGLELMKLSMNDPVTLESTRNMMERQTQQMVRLIDDLLDVSRITQGKLQLRKCRVELAEVIRSSVEAAKPFIDEAGHTLQVTMPSSPIILDADPNRLAQIISNLLSNAAKYTKEGGTIWLSAKRVDEQAVIKVKDTGIGIPADMKDAVFEMFAQIDRPMEKGYTGLGIGLTLVKRLVEMHEGTVGLHSEGVNQGSEFTVTVPVPSEQQTEDANAVIGQAPAKVDSRRVLVVDDNKPAAEMLRMVLKIMGHEIRLAHDGLEAVAAAEAFLPDLVLMDIGMPKMNGYEAAQKIRQQPWGVNMLLVALTGWGQEEDKQRTKEAGFDFHLTKPAEPAALQQLLAKRERQL